MKIPSNLHCIDMFPCFTAKPKKGQKPDGFSNSGAYVYQVPEFLLTMNSAKDGCLHEEFRLRTRNFNRVLKLIEEAYAKNPKLKLGYATIWEANPKDYDKEVVGCLSRLMYAHFLIDNGLKANFK